MDAPGVGFGTHEELEILVSDPAVSGHAIGEGMPVVRSTLIGLSLEHEVFGDPQWARTSKVESNRIAAKVSSRKRLVGSSKSERRCFRAISY